MAANVCKNFFCDVSGIDVGSLFFMHCGGKGFQAGGSEK
jgi:hypothetical protein